MFGRKREDGGLNPTEVNGIINMCRKLEEIEKRVDMLEKSQKPVAPRKSPQPPRENMEGEYKSTISGFCSPEDFKKLVGIVARISEKDGSFTFDSDYDKEEIYLHCMSKDDAMKKSLWLINKTEIDNLKFNVTQTG